jgi:Gas vesicle synthesis protein GvpL/GvpF
MRKSSRTTNGTYVYGIVRSLPSGPAQLPAVGDSAAQIRTIPSARCVAVVSDAADAFVDATADDLQAHSDVLQELLGSTNALVPLRFGTVYPDDETVVRELLEPSGGELDALLQLVENRVEARLKAFYVEDAILGEIVAEQPQVAELHRRTRALTADATYYDRIRLGELVAAALSAKGQRDAEWILSRLVPLAVDHRLEDEPHEWSLPTMSFLLERPGFETFQAALAALAEETEQRLQLRCIAPLPPYSFVSLPLDPMEAEVAWAS